MVAKKKYIYKLAQAKKGLMAIFEIVGRNIAVIEYHKSFDYSLIS